MHLHRVGVRFKQQALFPAAQPAEHVTPAVNIDLIIAQVFHPGRNGFCHPFFLSGVTLDVYQFLREGYQFLGYILTVDLQISHNVYPRDHCSHTYC